MTTAPLYGAFMKLKRADAHVQSLQKLIRAFESSDPFSIEIQRSLRSGKYLALYVARARVHREPKVIEWGTLIGDIVHNLRSALDHLVWSLTCNHSGDPPVPTNAKWRATQFPIFAEETPQARASMDRMLWGVDPQIKPKFEAFQPFRARKRGRHRHPLAVLQELWNTDKHRHVPLVAVLVRPPDIQYVTPTKGEVIFKRRGFGSFREGMELFRVGITYNPSPGEPQFHMKLRSQFVIAFPPGPPAYGGWLLDTLSMVYTTVQNILLAFEGDVT